MIKRIVFLLIILALICFGLYFGFSNNIDTDVNLIFFKVKTTVAVIVAVSFSAGFFIALILNVILKCFKACANFLFCKKPTTNEESTIEDCTEPKA